MVDQELEVAYGKRIDKVHQRLYDRMKDCMKQQSVEDCLQKNKDIDLRVDM